MQRSNNQPRADDEQLRRQLADLLSESYPGQGDRARHEHVAGAVVEMLDLTPEYAIADIGPTDTVHRVIAETTSSDRYSVEMKSLQFPRFEVVRRWQTRWKRAGGGQRDLRKF